MSHQSEMHLFAPGHSGCPGCAPSTVLIAVCDTLGKDIVVVNATGCMEITSSQYPNSAWRVPYIHSLFENAPAVASGVSAALKAKGNEHTKTVVIAGDGSTYDIGFGSLSGMLERGDDCVYICYDNELYANTGVQKSGATPLGAATTTTQAGKLHHGKERERKPIVEIAAAHNIPYAASASIAFFADFQMKLRKAAKIKGPTFVTVNAPCALGAGFDGAISMKVARLAVQSRMWFLFEYENGNFKLNFNPKAPKPVAEYLQLQKRFRHLTPPEIERIQKTCDHNYFDMLERQKASDIRKAAFAALENSQATPIAPTAPSTNPVAPKA
ncbi:MAG: thiamine pyrophosphate-dependent enzyme [Candidatus Diapherotrites archaeon]|nr:thiamine pyrophosphate-dependent enzyme [Candidatus Diapherotrites archaeon]